MLDLIGPRAARILLAGFAALLLSAGAGRCDTVVAFWSHGWGLGPNGMMYFPHAFVVITHSAKPGDPPQQEAWGYTAADPNDITVFARSSKGMVDQPNPDYRKKATLHFEVTASDEQYAALHKVIDTWGGPGAQLYNLKSHNCVGFVADLAAALGLQIPTTIGEDPSKFLEGVRRLNPGRLLEASAAAAPASP
ncbi:MAG TPA: hypothetical protein VN694_06915 [Caulobacteraceae bacterium]|nr:hypothetical protein [Caulobacteraceae bacterium]